MKKFLFVTLLILGVSTASTAQSGKEKEGGLFSRMFKKEQKPHKQMQHFDKPKKDKNIKHNGTSYNTRKKKKSSYNVDGDGFGTAGQGKRKEEKNN
ncbi:MAG: hypothetical protein IPH89_05055 [Bacteroidetes bacterium]|nr:hypothetical protein [Bacteroidota bacterium]